jgi:hypothetical protein
VKENWLLLVGGDGGGTILLLKNQGTYGFRFSFCTENSGDQPDG